MTDGTPLTLGRSFWAIDPLALPRLIEAHRHSGDLATLSARFGMAAPEVTSHKPGDRAGGAVAVLPLTGVLTPRMSLMSLLFGGGGNGLTDFRNNFRAAVASPDISAIVLDVDSPGGMIDLIPETAEEVRAARGSKPIVAIANTLAASAAYWIAAQADEIVVTPSGSVGSIGVYMVHEDYSGANEKDGVKPTYVSAGKYKIEGNPDEPLSKEGRAEWQAEADVLYAMFVDAVAAGRDVSSSAIREGYGEGRSLVASRALEAGLVDRIDTVESVVRSLLEESGSRGASRAAENPVEIHAHGVTHEPHCNSLCDGDTHFLVEDVTHSCSFKNDQGRLCLRAAGHENDHAFRVSSDDPEMVEEPEEEEVEVAEMSLPFDLEFVD